MHRYQARIPSPVIDRMDLVVPVDAPPATWPLEPGEPSSTIRARILVARERQQQRLRDTPWSCNAEIPASGNAITQLCPMVGEAEGLFAGFAFSRRPLLRMLRVAQTIADLEIDRDPGRPLGLEFFATAARLRQLPASSSCLT